MANYARFNGLQHLIALQQTVHTAGKHILCLCLQATSSLFLYVSIFLSHTHTHTFTLPVPDINQYDSKRKENIDPKHTAMMKAFICSEGSALICERSALFAEKMEVN